MSGPPANPVLRLFREGKRRRVYKVAGAYGAVSVGLIALADPVFPALGIPDVALTVLVVFLAFGFLVAVVMAWAFDITPEGVVRTGPALDPGVEPAVVPEPSQSVTARRSASAPARRGWRRSGRAATGPTRAEPEPSGLTAAPGLDEGTAQPDPDRVRRATLAHLRHELRTPINAVIGYSEMLIEDAEGDGVAGDLEDLGRIRKAGRELLSVVDLILNPEKYEGRELGNEDMEEFGRQLRYQLRTPIDSVIGYAELLIEGAEESGREYIVSDLERIHAAGKQLVDRITEIVEFPASLEGYRETSEELAKSSRIALDALSRIQALQPQRPEADELHEGHLLVVDDNAMNRELLSRQLARAGYTVTTADNGEEALDVVRHQDFDLVLLDIMMPGMNGYDVLRHLKQDEELRDVPVVMISALDEIDSVVRCIEMGAEDYLPKPFDPVLLRARIDASLGIRRLRDRQREIDDELRGNEELLDHLLMSVFPEPVAARFKAGEGDVVDVFPDATVLYAELEGPSRLITRSDPREFVGRLKDLFGVFDGIARGHGVAMTRLTGLSYVAVGGVPQADPRHVTAIAETALDMVDAIAEHSSSSRHRLRLRVGVHTGPVLAGIIGTDTRVAYDAWGETIDTARRMASNGAADRIHVSPAVYAALRETFSFENRGVIALDGKDRMRTYFLTGGAAEA